MITNIREFKKKAREYFNEIRKEETKELEKLNRKENKK